MTPETKTVTQINAVIVVMRVILVHPVQRVGGNAMCVERKDIWAKCVVQNLNPTRWQQHQSTSLSSPDYMVVYPTL